MIRRLFRNHRSHNPLYMRELTQYALEYQLPKSDASNVDTVRNHYRSLLYAMRSIADRQNQKPSEVFDTVLKQLRAIGSEQAILSYNSLYLLRLHDQQTGVDTFIKIT